MPETVLCPAKGRQPVLAKSPKLSLVHVFGGHTLMNSLLSMLMFKSCLGLGAAREEHAAILSEGQDRWMRADRACVRF